MPSDLWSGVRDLQSGGGTAGASGGYHDGRGVRGGSLGDGGI